MPAPVVRLDTTALQVAPGGQGSVVVTIRNMGDIVEGFVVEALGDPAATWASQPGEIPVYPQQEATAVLVFTVPDGLGAASGVVPFGVLVRSVVDPDNSAVVEGDIEVTQVHGLQPVLKPVTSRGRWRGRHELRITNWGNAPAQLRLVATDPDDRLGFLITPDVVDVPLGGTAKARISVRTRQPFLRGTQVRLPFQVAAEPATGAAPVPGPALGLPAGVDPRRVTVDGALTQVPILSRLVVTVALLAVVAAVAGVVYLVKHPAASSTDFANSAELPAPALKASPAAGGISLSWDPIQGVDGYSLITVDPTTLQNTNDVKPVAKEAAQFDVVKLEPGTKHCYVLQANRGKISSPSSVVCATTAAGSSTTSPATSGTGGTGTAPGGGGGGGGVPGNPAGGPAATDLIVELRVFPVAGSPNAEQQAQQAVQAFKADGVQASYLLSSAYPQWTRVPGPSTPSPLQPSYVVYLGPYKTAGEADAAQASCPSPPNDCLVFMPGPEQAG